jgi:hypothetical protein
MMQTEGSVLHAYDAQDIEDGPAREDECDVRNSLARGIGSERRKTYKETTVRQKIPPPYTNELQGSEMCLSLL